MKKLLIIPILLFGINCHAGEPLPFIKDGGKIEADFFNPQKLNVYDSNYKRTGYIQPDFFQPNDRLNIYNSSHEKIGTIERDFFNKDKWDIKKK